MFCRLLIPKASKYSLKEKKPNQNKNNHKSKTNQIQQNPEELWGSWTYVDFSTHVVWACQGGNFRKYLEEKYSLIQTMGRKIWTVPFICCYLTTHGTDIKEQLIYILSIKFKWTDVIISWGDFPGIEENIMNISTITRKKKKPEKYYNTKFPFKTANFSLKFSCKRP